MTSVEDHVNIADDIFIDEDNTDLDTSWIQHETQLQDIHANYSRETMPHICGVFIYINQNHYIEKITRDVIQLTTADSCSTSYIAEDVILKIIQTKKLRTPVSKYKFTNAFINVVDIEPEKIQSFSKTKEDELAQVSFFKEISIIGPIHIPSSIFIFHSINTVYFFFQEIPVTKHKYTLKSILKTQPDIKEAEPVTKMNKNITKKVRIFDKQEMHKNYKQSLQKRGTRKRRM